MRDILLQVLTRSALTAVDDGRTIVSGLAAADPALIPQVCDEAEPLRTKFTEAALADCWGGKSFMWRSPRRAAEGHIIKRVWERDTHAYVLLEAASTRIDPVAVARVLAFLASEFGADYGFMHLFTRPDGSRSGPSDPFSSGRNPYLMPTVAELERCLPTLFWGNVLGPPYVELIGEDVVNTAPAAVVKKLASSTYYLQVTDRAEDLRRDYAGFDRQRQGIVEHLGRDLFWDPKLGSRGRYRAPYLSRTEAKDTRVPAGETTSAMHVASVVADLTEHARRCVREDGWIHPVAMAVSASGQREVVATNEPRPEAALASLVQTLQHMARERPLLVAAIVHGSGFDSESASRVVVHVESSVGKPTRIIRGVQATSGEPDFGDAVTEHVASRLLRFSQGE